MNSKNEERRGEPTVDVTIGKNLETTQAFQFQVDGDGYVAEQDENKWQKKDISAHQVSAANEVSYLISSFNVGPENCFYVENVEPFHARVEVDLSNQEAPKLAITAPKGKVRVKTAHGTHLLAEGQTHENIGRNDVVSIGEYFKCYFTVAKSKQNPNNWELVMIPLIKQSVEE